MPRPPRIHAENAVYYVTLEGSNEQKFFQDDADYQKYLSLLRTYKSEFQFQLFAYALLPHRIELLLEVHEEHPISTVMQKITPLYTKYFNARHDRKGPLFQKRFHSIIAEKDTYLSRLVRFVHMAPVRYGAGADAEDYAYTNVRSYLAGEPSALESGEKEEVLENVELGLSYSQFLASITDEEKEFLEKKVSRGFALGSEEFVASLRQKTREQAHKTETATVSSAVSVYESSRKLVVYCSAVALAVAVSGFSYYLGHQKPAPFNAYPNSKELAIATVKAMARSANAVAKEEITANLNGTVWEIEMVSVSADGVESPIKDKIKFLGKSFESYHFWNQGFTPSNYTVTVKNGVVTWETMQMNERGEKISWRGDWQGGKMEGVVSYEAEGKNQDFQFISRPIEQGKVNR